MNAQKKSVKIAILDDSDFYNRLLTHELENYCKMLSLEYQMNFTIDSYVDVEKFTHDLSDELDIAFIDFYLCSTTNGAEVAKLVREKCSKCKVVMISQSNTTLTNAKSKNAGAREFIHKDKEALNNACLSIRSIAVKKLTHAR